VLDYVQQRKQSAADRRLPAVQLRLADMAMKIEAARLLIYGGVERLLGLAFHPAKFIAKCFANEMVAKSPATRYR